MVRLFCWFEYMPVTHGVTGSSPVRTALLEKDIWKALVLLRIGAFLFIYSSVLPINISSALHKKYSVGLAVYI